MVGRLPFVFLFPSGMLEGCLSERGGKFMVNIDVEVLRLWRSGKGEDERVGELGKLS